MAKTIKMEKIKLTTYVSKRLIDEAGGKEKMKALLYDILDRYGNPEYFDYDAVEEQ